MARKQSRAKIPAAVRQQLWIDSGGRCAFRGCNKSVSRDFLTLKGANIGEMAHIVADSPDGARGVAGLSEELAKDVSNLMLACYDCHSRVDRYGQNNEYSAEDLRQMKREHEARIELIYSSNGVKDSLPIIMTFPIAGHVPVIDERDINYAILTNSEYKRFPTKHRVNIDRADFDVKDDSADFWPRAERIIEKIFEQRIQPELNTRNKPTHISIAAFAPIPLLMKLGALLGDKMDAAVLDLPTERWLWDKSEREGPRYQYDVPEKLTEDVVVKVSISNTVQVPISSMNSAEFRAVAPNRGIIRSEADVLEFRRQFNMFLMGLSRAGAKRLHIYPATPLSASLEIGRILLPKVFEEVYVMEWRASTWIQALRLK